MYQNEIDKLNHKLDLIIGVLLVGEGVSTQDVMIELEKIDEKYKT